MSLSSSLGAVIMPRTSNLIAENKMDEFKVLIQNHTILFYVFGNALDCGIDIY